MIYLMLRDSEKARIMLRNFERFLEAYNLKVIHRAEQEELIELTINTSSVTEIKRVDHLAIDFFNGELISLRTELSEVVAVTNDLWQQNSNKSASSSGKLVGD